MHDDGRADVSQGGGPLGLLDAHVLLLVCLFMRILTPDIWQDRNDL